MKQKSISFGVVLATLVVAELGVLLAVALTLSQFGPDFRPLAALIVGSLLLVNAAIWLSYPRFQALKESSRRLGLLAEMNVQVSREILVNEDIELIYRTVLNYLFSVFKTATSGSVLVLGTDDCLTFAASRGFSEEFVNGFHIKLEHSFLYQLTEGKITETRLITTEDFSDIRTVLKPENWQYRSVISAPIFVGDRLFGLLNLDSSVDDAYELGDVDIVDRFRTQIEIILLARERYTQDIKSYQVDALTGLFTRRYFEDLFKISLERAIRHQESFVIAMFDVDRLKFVNDNFGHLAGDRMLLFIANALRTACRASDIMGRLGGDEFIACYPLSSVAAMDKSLAGVRSKVRASRLRFADTEHRPSFSYGLASFPDDGSDLESLIASADSRLYGMKSQRAPGFRDTLPFGILG